MNAEQRALALAVGGAAVVLLSYAPAGVGRIGWFLAVAGVGLTYLVLGLVLWGLQLRKPVTFFRGFIGAVGSVLAVGAIALAVAYAISPPVDRWDRLGAVVLVSVVPFVDSLAVPFGLTSTTVQDLDLLGTDSRSVRSWPRWVVTVGLVLVIGSPVIGAVVVSREAGGSLVVELVPVAIVALAFGYPVYRVSRTLADESGPS